MELGNEYFSAFDKGIRRIICKYSAGKTLTEEVSPEIHQHREILFILRGESTFSLNNKLFKVKSGDVILIDRWISHRYGYPPADRNMLYLWFYLFPTHLNLRIHQFDQDGNKNEVVRWGHLPMDAKFVIDRRWDELDKLDPKAALANLESFLKQPLTMLLDEFRFYLQTNDSKDEKNPTNNELVASIQQIIEAKKGRDCSLAQLEKFTGFSRFYISHLFKNAYGISIGDYINRVRMIFFESAKKQGFSHKQIAFELGFSSNSALLMWYRKNKEKFL
jgi:AraC-like DNA-binding protein